MSLTITNTPDSSAPTPATPRVLSPTTPPIAPSPQGESWILNPVVLNTSIQGIQYASVLSPPIIIYRSLLAPPLTSHRMTATKFFRSNTIGTFLIGGVLFGQGIGVVEASKLLGGEGVWMKSANGLGVRGDGKGMKKGERRKRDYMGIGAFIGGLATTTIFLRSVPLIWAIPGGAGLGIAVGYGVDMTTPSGEEVKKEVILAE